jgi:hypothetical protein
MFVRHESEIGLPMSEVERRLDDLRTDLGSMADVAYREGEELRARVGPGSGAIAKEVHLAIGTPEIHRSGLIYPVRWSAVGSENLFPRLTADLVVSHVGHARTRITLEGTYQPPLGPLGKVMDRALLRHVAESTIRAWTERLAESLASEVREPGS